MKNRILKKLAARCWEQWVWEVLIVATTVPALVHAARSLNDLPH